MSRSRSLQLLLAALFAMSITVACAEQTAQKPAPPPDTRKADEAAIRANSADWSKASQAKDLDKATSYYTDDAIFFVNNGAMVKGKDGPCGFHHERRLSGLSLADRRRQGAPPSNQAGRDKGGTH